MVDDDPQDIYLTKRAFCSYMPDLRFRGVESGSALFDYLYCRGEFEGNDSDDLPDVILLDINIPRENGFEILENLKKDEAHCHIPVSMLTTSIAPFDLQQAYSKGANSYIRKTISAGEMQITAEQFCNYWFDLVQLPNAA